MPSGENLDVAVCQRTATRTMAGSGTPIVKLL
jgi:hypothetical protein